MHSQLSTSRFAPTFDGLRTGKSRIKAQTEGVGHWESRSAGRVYHEAFEILVRVDVRQQEEEVVRQRWGDGG